MNHQHRSLPLSLRSPLARLNENGEENVAQYSASGGRTTRAISRKLRRLFDENGSDENENENDEYKNCAENENPLLDGCFATSEKNIGDDSSNRMAYDRKKNTTTTMAQTPTTALTTTTTKKKTKSKATKRTSIGRWETWERFEFLRGLRKHGKGNWKKIGESIPTRYVRYMRSIFVFVPSPLIEHVCCFCFVSFHIPPMLKRSFFLFLLPGNYRKQV